MKVTKAVVLAGGLGTRMAPISKVLAKEMLPIVDKPLLEYIIEDLKKCGITEILIILHKSKSNIVKYFENDNTKISYIFPNGANGVVDALLHAQSFVCGEPFVLIFGDGLFVSKKSSIKQMLETFYKTKESVIASTNVEKNQISLYGILEYKKQQNSCYIYNIIEKPKNNQTKFRSAIVGQYVFNPQIFDYIKSLKVGELFTDALLSMAKDNCLVLTQINAYYFDIGSKAGFVKANIFLSLKHKETQKEVKKYLNILLENSHK